MRPRRRIVGIDPGTQVAGFCVIDFDCDSGKDVRLLDCGVIRTQGRRPFRLAWLHEKLTKLFQKYKSERVDVAIETAWVGKNAATAIIIGEARGVVLAACGALDDVRVFNYAPSEAKKSVGGFGGASKYQVAAAVRLILKVDEDLPLDATDAASIALHHYLTGSSESYQME